MIEEKNEGSVYAGPSLFFIYPTKPLFQGHQALGL